MKESLKDRIFSSVITAFLIVFAAIELIPLLSVVAQSFSSRAASDMNIVTIYPIGFTLASWKHILADVELWKSFGISVVTTVIGTFLALLITTLMAYPLGKKEFKFGGILMFIVVLSMIFKAPVVPYFLTVRNLGLYNNIFVLIIPHILNAYNLAIMRTFFKQFPEEIEEAARIDGCGYFQLLYRIVVPSSKAVLTTVGLFYAVTMWNQFQHPMMFISDTDLFPLQMKIRQMINSGGDVMSVVVSSQANYSRETITAATVVFAIIPVIILYPWLQKHFEKGAMLGSVKG